MGYVTHQQPYLMITLGLCQQRRQIMLLLSGAYQGTIFTDFHFCPQLRWGRLSVLAATDKSSNLT